MQSIHCRPSECDVGRSVLHTGRDKMHAPTYGNGEISRREKIKVGYAVGSGFDSDDGRRGGWILCTQEMHDSAVCRRWRAHSELCRFNWRPSETIQGRGEIKRMLQLFAYLKRLPPSSRVLPLRTGLPPPPAPWVKCHTIQRLPNTAPTQSESWLFHAALPIPTALAPVRASASVRGSTS